jgi:arylsulfatase A-like enzyme
MKLMTLKAIALPLLAAALAVCPMRAEVKPNPVSADETFLPRGKDTRPNIILIISDDHTWSHYGFMGHGIVQTPHLDRMARESLLYTRGYATPVCSPSLATLLTGKQPSRHGITGNDLHGARHTDRTSLRERLLSNKLILPKALSEAGYLTYQTGKLWNSSFKDMGFTHGMTEKRDRHGGAGLPIGRKGMEPIYQFIDGALEEKMPFFVWYAPFLPHDPHNPPERLLKKYLGRGPTKHAEIYHAMVEWLDETCGELDGFLEKKGLKENTMILYLADNGWDPEQGYQGSRAKLTPYENGIRTPMFLRWPGKVAPLRDEETLASILDFAPTILNVAGVKAPEKLPGIDLRDREAMQARKKLFVEAHRHDIMDLTNPLKSRVALTVIDGWMKLIVPGPVTHHEEKKKFAQLTGGIELFDLKNDPGEKINLAERKPEETTRLKTMVDRYDEQD